MLYRMFQSNGNNSVFIHPSDASQKLRFVVLSQPKKVSGLALTNRRVSIKVTRSHDPRGPECAASDPCALVLEPLSVELVISGSTRNIDALDLSVQDIITAYQAKKVDLLNVGAAPSDNTGLDIHVTTP